MSLLKDKLLSCSGQAKNKEKIYIFRKLLQFP